jgi:hypothetical protein
MLGQDLSLRSSPSGLTGIGATLRDARESLGISFETAERDTHIPRHHLQALEEERFDAFHAPVYVRGFLRSYSQYLKLDSGELLDLLPPDRPLEEERLASLSRLGRPRGPREAAMERRDPAARDVPPLTSAAFNRIAHRRPDYDPDELTSGVQVQEHQAGPTVVPRLDPLGRLGWPESPEQASQPFDGAETEKRSRSTFSRTSWEQPLSPRRSRHWNATPRVRSLLPEDTRALTSQPSLLALAGAVCALALLWVLVRAISGPDVSPTVMANAGPNATVKIPAAAGQPSAHGRMPNLMGTDLNTALGSLQKSGVVPVVVAVSAGDPAGLPVSAQVPNPGADLHPETAVLIVVGGGN